ncbi:MAG TPA: hypothetical protein VMA83_12470 [Solirubrobacteraceae bacterium]|nr:hypothetical protein [Solirubrobacteraceae bacterium]
MILTFDHVARLLAEFVVREQTIRTVESLDEQVAERGRGRSHALRRRRERLCRVDG